MTPEGETEKLMEVEVKNGKGVKRVTMKTNGKVKTNTMKLKKGEIKNIQAGKFMPGLFKPCFSNLKCTRPNGGRRKTHKQKSGN